MVTCQLLAPLSKSLRLRGYGYQPTCSIHSPIYNPPIPSLPIPNFRQQPSSLLLHRRSSSGTLLFLEREDDGGNNIPVRMSGGVGTSADVGIGKVNADDGPKPSSAAPSTPRRSYFSFQQLNVLAVMIVLSASGMVSPSELALTAFSLIYIIFLSRAAFPHLQPTSAPPPPVFGARCRPLAVYVSVGGIIGLLLPVAYILHGLIQGDQEGVQAAAPHLFLLSSQVFFEGISFAAGFSLPVRAFVPVFYNSVRLFAISDWLRAEFGKEDGQHGSPQRLLAGRTLAVANMAFWAFNLFGFLLPMYLPRAFRSYYGYKEKA